MAGARISPEIVEYPDLKKATGRVEARVVLHSRRRGGRMSDERDEATVVELLLREPEIVAWLDDHRPPPDEPHDDDEPLHAARI
jgi:hypothetical protein